MLIKTENTNNPDVRNFYPEEKFNIKGSAEFTDSKSLRKSPLAEAIFDLGGVESVLITPDMVSVTIFSMSRCLLPSTACVMTASGSSLPSNSSNDRFNERSPTLHTTVYFSFHFCFE